MSSTAAALEHAHVCGVVHCDVSPGNILIDAENEVRLTDFGIARIGEVVQRTNGQTVVVSGALGWHPGYSAPEVLMHQQPRSRSDQYSLARVCLSLVRREVFGSPSPVALPGTLRESKSAALRRALRTDADARFPSISAFADAFCGV